jgi:RNA polymerase sigma factor (sigma-70 family)
MIFPPIHTTEIPDLLARHRQGDRQAGDELLRRMAGRLERLARRKLADFPLARSQEQTSDVIQEASWRLLAALRRARPTNTRRLYRLAARHIHWHLLDLVRRLRQHPCTFLDRPADVVQPDDADLDECQAIHEAVETLPAELREVFSLRIYHGLRWKRIAEILNIDIRTAYRHWGQVGVLLRRRVQGGSEFGPDAR